MKRTALVIVSALLLVKMCSSVVVQYVVVIKCKVVAQKEVCAEGSLFVMLVNIPASQ